MSYKVNDPKEVSLHNEMCYACKKRFLPNNAISLFNHNKECISFESLRLDKNE
jgi:hypothetical protein